MAMPHNYDDAEDLWMVLKVWTLELSIGSSENINYTKLNVHKWSQCSDNQVYS